MKIQRITKWLMVLLLCLAVAPSVHAETDPNASVSDCIGKGKDCSSKDEVKEKGDSTAVPEEPVLDEPKGLSAGDYIRTLLAFVFVIGLLVWLLRFLNKRNRSFDQNRLMTNMGGVPLGQHKSIQLVKMGDHYFVVGVGENVQLLREIDDPDEIADLLARYDQAGSDIQKGLIAQLYDRFFSKTKASDAETESSDFSNVFAAKMEEIKADRRKQLDRLKGKGSDRNG